MPPNGPDNWNEYRRLMLAELERHEGWLKVLETRKNELRVEVERLKIKAGIWGLMGGLIPAVAAALLWLLSRAI